MEKTEKGVVLKQRTALDGAYFQAVLGFMSYLYLHFDVSLGGPGTQTGYAFHVPVIEVNVGDVINSPNSACV